MAQIQITNTDDLMSFIKSDKVSTNQAANIVSKALDVLIISDFTKDQLIQHTQNFIDDFCLDGATERPIFLGLDLSIVM